MEHLSWMYRLSPICILSLLFILVMKAIYLQGVKPKKLFCCFFRILIWHKGEIGSSKKRDFFFWVSRPPKQAKKGKNKEKENNYMKIEEKNVKREVKREKIKKETPSPLISNAQNYTIRLCIEQSQIGFFFLQNDPFFLYACATWSEVPSNTSPWLPPSLCILPLSQNSIK